MHLDGKPSVRGRDEYAATDAHCLGYEATLPFTPTDVLDDGVREDDVELAVAEGKGARIALHIADPGIAGAKAGSVVQPESGDALGPWVELLEEVQRAAAVALAEAQLVGADVENGGLGGRAELLHEEPELSPARAEGDGVGEAHRRKYGDRPHGVRLHRSTQYAPSVVESAIRPPGPYSLRLTSRTSVWRAPLPDGRWASARQLHDGTVIVRASCERAVEEARFVLALDDDTGAFHRRFARDPLLGPSLNALRGLRPRRKATVAHAVLRAVCGQLIQSGRAREIERAVIRACGEDPPTQETLARLSPAALCARGLAASRAATLTRLVRTLDLESLKASPGTALARLRRERGVGPWSVGVISLQGLGRYDVGLVADLGLVKLLASVRGRWPEPAETAELLEPYGEWQGLASVFLLAGFKRGLIPGASADRARLARARTGRAA